MRSTHSLAGLNLDLLRSFFLVAEFGSLNQAADRLRVSQSTLTRQMQALEHELGGRLLERTSTGVALTATGNALLKQVRPALADLDHALADVRRLGRGQSAALRIGYLQSAARDYLNPALAKLRSQHPQVKLTLRDLSPGEQIEALRHGEIDVALVGGMSAFLEKEFYVKRVASLPMFTAVAEDHELASRASLRLTDLRGALFVGAPDADIPGHNRWLTQCCRQAGFRPRFVGDADGLAHALTLVVSENAVTLLPEYSSCTPVPGVAFIPLRDAAVKWDLLVAWQRGKPSAVLQTLLANFSPTAGRKA